jgi:hypothetical protein
VGKKKVYGSDYYFKLVCLINLFAFSEANFHLSFPNVIYKKNFFDMKKCIFILFVLVLGIAQMKADTAADLQGLWTLTTLQGGDSTMVAGDTVWVDETEYYVLTEAGVLTDGGKYLFDFPLTTTTLNITGTDFIFTYYDSGSRAWSGSFDLADPDLYLYGTADNCAPCDPKTIHLIIRSVSANQLVVDLYDEDWATTTFAHFTFTK